MIGQPSIVAGRATQASLRTAGAVQAHPAVAPLVRGGKLREYSAHLIPESGWAMKPKLYTDGMLVAGDAAGFCLAAGLYLEGMNYAMQSGLAAAKQRSSLPKGNFSARTLSVYQKLEAAPRFHRFSRLSSRAILRQRAAPAKSLSEMVAQGMEQIFPGGRCAQAEDSTAGLPDGPSVFDQAGAIAPRCLPGGEGLSMVMTTHEEKMRTVRLVGATRISS